MLPQAQRKPIARVERAENHFDSASPSPGIILNTDRIASMGALVKQQRLTFGLSQHELSRLSGVPQTYISELENGIAPNLDGAADVIAALKNHAYKIAVAAVNLLHRGVA